jgi:hypothetical protein
VFGALWLTAGAGTVAVFAQADVANSTVKGKVMDQTGAAVVGATINVLNADRGVVRSVRTDVEGAYQAPLLQPGAYDLRVEASGFQSQVLQNVVLTVGQVGVHYAARTVPAGSIVATERCEYSSVPNALANLRT